MKKGNKTVKKVDRLMEIRGTLLILLTAFISGGAIVINKFFIVRVDPLVFTAIRAFFIGIIFLLISLFIANRSNKSFKYKNTSWASLLSIGVIGGGFAFWLFFTGLRLTTAGRAAFLHKTLPIYAAVLAIIFLREKIRPKQFIALAIMLLGLLFMEFTKLSPEMRLGDILVLSATILWAVENTISKRAMLNHESNWVITFSRMFFGSLLLIGIVLISNKLNIILALTSQQMIYIATSTVILLLYVLTWYWGLKYINLSKASSILLLSPVITLILGMIFLNEQVLPMQLLGSLLILIGAYFVIRSKSEIKVSDVV